MTTYKKYSIKNRKTRKIKLFKGGGTEGDIQKVAIDTVNTKISTGATGNTPVKSGKKVSILIDFYEKLLKPENYGNNLNFNKFYEIVNINKNGINTAESITGVEELFEIFKKEIKYIKATDEENKVETEKDLKSNLKKTKEIIIDYRDNGDFTINGEKGAAAPTVSVIQAAPGAVRVPVTAPGTGAAPVPSAEDSIKETAINELKSNIEKANIDKEIYNTYNKIELNKKITETDNQFILDETLYELNKEIQGKTNELKKINDTITEIKKNLSNLTETNTKLKTGTENLEEENNNLTQKINDGDLSQKKKTADKIAINNKNIEKNKNSIKGNIIKIRAIRSTLKQQSQIYENKNRELIDANDKKENNLKLLNRVYDRLIEELSKNKLKSGIFRVKGEGDYDIINANINTIKEKIQILESGRINKTKLKQASDVILNKMFNEK